MIIGAEQDDCLRAFHLVPNVKRLGEVHLPFNLLGLSLGGD
jgi:hypothetical protein